jgi:hypothetical protein
MKKLFLITLLSLTAMSCKDKKEGNAAKALVMAAENTPQDASGDWEVLFDGTNLEHWKGYLTEQVSDNWKIEEGILTLYPPKERKKGESYNIVSKKNYTNFVLQLESNIAEGGNSGVFWGVKEDEKFGQPYQTGPEIQVLDNERHPDAKAGTTHQAGALYDMVAPSEDVANPAGEWNTMEITINHTANEGKIVLNGKQIVTFPVNGEGWNAMVAKSKFATWEAFGKYPTGKIGLQDHGDKVSFRNIKIKAL